MCIANLSEEMASTFLFKGFSQWVANIEATTVDMARREKKENSVSVGNQVSNGKIGNRPREKIDLRVAFQHCADCSNSVVWSRVTNLGEMLCYFSDKLRTIP
jgi:hypothetical protein